MSTVINKTTLEIRVSVNTPEYQDGNWLITPNPELLIQVISGEVPKRHTKIEGDDYLLKTSSEIEQADAEYLAEVKTQKIAEIREQFNETFTSRYATITSIAATNIRTTALASMNDDATEYLDQIIIWGLQGDDLIEVAEAQVESSTTIEGVNAVTWNVDGWLENDPLVSTRVARRM